jgi:uncharacterized protein YaiI (UPF0178 family)
LNFKIWVDADAIPGPAKEIIIHAAVKRVIQVTFVANKLLVLPSSKLISFVQVNSAPDAADHFIAESAEPGDLVITQDIPLAHTLVRKGVSTINSRGGQFTEENIGERLSMRDLKESLRDQGQMTGGPSAFGPKEKRAFAATFDRELTKLIAKKKV